MPIIYIVEMSNENEDFFPDKDGGINFDNLTQDELDRLAEEAVNEDIIEEKRLGRSQRNRIIIEFAGLQRMVALDVLNTGEEEMDLLLDDNSHKPLFERYPTEPLLTPESSKGPIETMPYLAIDNMELLLGGYNDSNATWEYLNSPGNNRHIKNFDENNSN